MVDFKILAPNAPRSATWRCRPVVASLVIALYIALTPPIAADATGTVRSARVGSSTAPRIEGPGPAMLTPRKSRLAALTCHGVPGAKGRAPVLLVPGTRVQPTENWGPSYLPVLLHRGHAVCMVELPGFGMGDVQVNSEYVATAIRTMTDRFHKKVSIIGHSQGAYLPRIAVRTWPDLADHVDDLIGLAGVYDRGSTALRGRCPRKCPGVLHQLAAGSSFLATMSRRRLPPGPSYTNIGTLGDGTITPQPAANRQNGARAIMIQDVCPGRIVPLAEHPMIVGDKVALALSLDALDHAGPAATSRLDSNVCRGGQYREFKPVQYLAVATIADLRTGTPVSREPRLFCRYSAACRKPSLRGRLITRPRYVIQANAVVVHTRALAPGRIQVRLGQHRINRMVVPGSLTISIPRSGERSQLKILTRPRYFTADAIEAASWIPARHRRSAIRSHGEASPT